MIACTEETAQALVYFRGHSLSKWEWAGRIYRKINPRLTWTTREYLRKCLHTAQEKSK